MRRRAASASLLANGRSRWVRSSSAPLGSESKAQIAKTHGCDHPIVYTHEDFVAAVSGAVKIEINQSYPLKDAAQAHRDLESRKTVGSTVLTV